MRRRIGKLAALLAVTGVATVAIAAPASADKPNFNPGQKGNVCSAPGPNSNPNCVPG
jgi:hypothetical protein